jgi:hypothetical protein
MDKKILENWLVFIGPGDLRVKSSFGVSKALRSFKTRKKGRGIIIYIQGGNPSGLGKFHGFDAQMRMRSGMSF